MRFLANENIPEVVVHALQEHGHDVRWIRTFAPGSTDQDVITFAVDESRILLTFDKDFGEIAFRHGLPVTAGIILLRLSPLSPQALVELIITFLDNRDDWAGHFSVIEPRRIRMTPLK